MQVKIINRSPYPLPQYATAQAAGLDLQANIPQPLTIMPLARYLMPTGLYIELPNGYEAQVRPRSGIALKCGITVINSPGTIDPDYRGEIKIPLINLSDAPVTINPGDRVAQMIISRFERIEWNIANALSDSSRGTGGFGHTGI